MTDPAPTCGDERQIVTLTVIVEILKFCLLDHQIAASLGKLFQLSGEFHSLIDRLSGAIEFGFPEQRPRVGRPGNSECYALGNGAFIFPKIDSQISFALKGILEEKLAGTDSPIKDLLRCAVGDQCNFVLVLQ
jgi:hypothetical protein